METATLGIQKRRRQLFDNFIIIWLDTNKNEMYDKCQETMIHHRISSLTSVQKLSDLDQCVDFLTNIDDDDKVFLIISGNFGETLIPCIYLLAQLHSIYILDNQHKHQWANEYRKVKDNFTDVGSIFDQIERDMKQSQKDSTSISIINSSSTHVNQLDQSFMYSQLLKEIIIEEPFDEEAKQKFIDFCHKYYTEHNIDLNVIDKFIHDYDIHSPIWWYTKEIFIYSMVNRALRTQNIEVIIKMGFFIRDLHQQIGQRHQDEMQSTEKMIVYRGQGLSHSDFEKLINSQGGLLSFNNFLSTSTDQQVSYIFADSAGSDSDLIGILFRMEIDPTIRSSPFTSLDNVSYYESSEKEVLFSMHTVFRIGKIQQIEHHLWHVDLILTNDDDEQLRQLTEQMRQITCGSTRLERLGALMIEMGESNKAQEMYETMLETARNIDVKENAELHHQLGYVFDQKGELDRALLHYRKSLKLHLTFVSPDDPCMSTIYSNIGSVLHDLGEYDEALEHYQRALTIAAGKSAEKDALFHNNIGTVLRDKGKYDEALKSYKCALNIQLDCLSSLHPSLATTYGNIGQVHFSMGDNLTALSYYQKVLDIHKRSLPSEHPLVATCMNNMASIYYALEDYLTAISYYQKALNIMEKSESCHYPTLAVIYINIAMIFQLLGQTNEAIERTARAVDIASQVLGSDHPETLKYKQYLNNLKNSF